MKSLRFTLLILLFAISFAASGQINHKHYITMGRIDLSKEDFNAAIQNLNVAIQAKPNDFEAYFLRGIAKFSLNDFSGAVDDFSKTIELHPLYVRAYHYRGISNDHLGNYADAQKDFDKAISLDPYSTELHLAVGMTKIHVNDYEGAIAAFDTALIISPNNTDAYISRGIANAIMERYDDALIDMNKAVENDFFNAEALIRRGMIQIERKEYSKAMDDFNNAITLDASNPLIYFNRAIVYLNLGDTLSALRDYEKVNMIDQRNALTYFNRAILYSIMEENDIALALYNKVIEINPDNIYGYFNRGILNYMMKNLDDAEDDFTKVIELFPDYIDAWVNRSVVRYEKNDLQGAEQDQIKAKEIMNMVSEDDTNIDSLFAHYSGTIGYDRIIQFESDFVNGERKGKLSQYSDIDIAPADNYVVSVIGNETYKKSSRKEYFIDATLSQLSENCDFDGKIVMMQFDFFDDDHNSILNDSIIGLVDNEDVRLFLEGISNFEIFNYKHAETAFESLINHQSLGVYAGINLAVLQYAKANLLFSEQNYIEPIGISQKRNIDNVTEFRNIRPDYTETMNTLQILVNKYPDNPFVWYLLGNVHLQMQEFNKAIDDYTLAIRYENSLAEAYYNRALTLLYIGEKNLAADDLSKAGELGIKEAYVVIKRFF